MPGGGGEYHDLRTLGTLLPGGGEIPGITSLTLELCGLLCRAGVGEEYQVYSIIDLRTLGTLMPGGGGGGEIQGIAHP